MEEQSIKYMINKPCKVKLNNLLYIQVPIILIYMKLKVTNNVNFCYLKTYKISNEAN